jgi:hypothetical protein
VAGNSGLHSYKILISKVCYAHVQSLQNILVYVCVVLSGEEYFRSKSSLLLALNNWKMNGEPCDLQNLALSF